MKGTKDLLQLLMEYDHTKLAVVNVGVALDTESGLRGSTALDLAVKRGEMEEKKGVKESEGVKIASYIQSLAFLATGKFYLVFKFLKRPVI